MVMYLFIVYWIFQVYHASRQLIKAVFLFTRTNVRILFKILSQRLCEILVLERNHSSKHKPNTKTPRKRNATDNTRSTTDYKLTLPYQSNPVLVLLLFLNFMWKPIEFTSMWFGMMITARSKAVNHHDLSPQHLGSLSAQLTIKIFFQTDKFSSTSSKVKQNTYSPLNKGSYVNKGRKTGKESKATLEMLCLVHFV